MHEKREEQYRVRKCVILFYLEDDTIQVNEPQVENSGIPQGEFLPGMKFCISSHCQCYGSNTVVQ